MLIRVTVILCLVSDENYDYGAGIRFSKERNKGLVQIVNGRYATGGDTTIEAGYGKFNMLKRRDGNRYIHIQSTDLLSVGSDDAGDRISPTQFIDVLIRPQLICILLLLAQLSVRHQRVNTSYLSKINITIEMNNWNIQSYS